MKNRSGLRNSLKKFGHLIGGFVIIVKGYSKYEEHHAEIGIVLILLGLLFASFGVFHEKIPWMKNTSLGFCGSKAWRSPLFRIRISASENLALPLTYALCSVAYFIVGGYFYNYRETH